ncbi:MAG TPA: polysaccharide deacetylase family protein [Candidatus Caccovivens faecavium]|nr:polysaccharide deacetylase family protein [Candidatus Caccovivens faecavium]
MKIWTFNLHRQFINFLIVIMLVVVSTLAVLGVSLSTTSSFINDVYYSGNTDSNKISLMINVYWGTEYLDGMLEILYKYDVKTTFFVGGTWAVKESDMLQKIHDAGHEIGNHGYSHKDQDKLNREQNKNEILTTHTLVNDLIGVNMDLFAPPSGAYNKTTVEVATELGYKTIMWTRDTIDWRDKDEEIIYSRAIKDAKGGDLILMHPTACTLLALERIIVSLQGEGFVLTTVSENLADS